MSSASVVGSPKVAPGVERTRAIFRMFPPSRRQDCHSAAPHSPFSRCFNRDEEGGVCKMTELSPTAVPAPVIVRRAVGPLLLHLQPATQRRCGLDSTELGRRQRRRRRRRQTTAATTATTTTATPPTTMTTTTRSNDNGNIDHLRPQNKNLSRRTPRRRCARTRSSLRSTPPGDLSPVQERGCSLSSSSSSSSSAPSPLLRPSPLRPSPLRPLSSLLLQSSAAAQRQGNEGSRSNHSPWPSQRSPASG